MGRKPCFMSDEAYSIIKSYCDASGKTIYDATNEAIMVYNRLLSLGVNLSLFLTELELYKLLKQAEVLRINLEIPPETLATYLGSYLMARSVSENTVLNNLFSILNLLLDFMDGKPLPIPSNNGNTFTYSFKNEKAAIYFENVIESLARMLNESYSLSLKVKRDGTVVRVTE